ncbi:MAG: helix-turn-helix domain-containing protein [Spirochaetaceae bacterium]|jgi:transcriptional regulator with XRE-family HTH domain|nr:helix-turn-helix domain-containing protein [Spirochaetaceae bacterium]
MYIQAIFAENMRKYRKQVNLTQERLAELCGTDHRYIGQIETGRRCPSLEYVERIASALNIAPYRLFYSDSAGDTAADPRRLQKEKIKAMLNDNFSRICAIIDEEY